MLLLVPLQVVRAKLLALLPVRLVPPATVVVPARVQLHQLALQLVTVVLAQAPLHLARGVTSIHPQAPALVEQLLPLGGGDI